jgi:ferredoxin
MTMKVEFKVSGKIASWGDTYENLLELAEENGIEIETQCEAGMCGTCKVKLLSGEVHMEVDDGLDDDDRENNYILPCVAIPKTDIVLEI